MASVAGNTTVFDSDEIRGDSPDFKKSTAFSGSSSSGQLFKDSTKQVPFLTTIDGEQDDRPFFIRIGKDGALPALQELDRQLIEVSHPLLPLSLFI